MMQVEVTVGSARDLKNVNWRHGELKPYVVLWINDDGPKCSTRVVDGENSADWDWGDDKVIVPLPPSSASLSDAVLYIDVVHADAGEDVKPLVGSARLPLRDVINDAGIGGKASRTLRLKRPSGRPQGCLDVRVAIREVAAQYYGGGLPGYPSPYPYYGQPQPQPGPYAAPPSSGYPAATAAPGYGGGAPPPQPVMDDPCQSEEKKSSAGGKMGMGTGLAVGAAAGVLGGLALAGGASYMEDKFEENVADKVEEDLAAARDDDDYYY